VGSNEVITPAWNLTDASLVKARLLGQNEYIPAKIKVIDYEIDLAIVELEPNSLKKALKPIKFTEKFQRGAKLNYLLAQFERQPDDGAGVFRQGEVHRSPTSYANFPQLYRYKYVTGNGHGTALLRRPDACGNRLLERRDNGGGDYTGRSYQ